MEIIFDSFLAFFASIGIWTLVKYLIQWIFPGLFAINEHESHCFIREDTEEIQKLKDEYKFDRDFASAFIIQNAASKDINTFYD